MIGHGFSFGANVDESAAATASERHWTTQFASLILTDASSLKKDVLGCVSNRMTHREVRLRYEMLQTRADAPTAKPHRRRAMLDYDSFKFATRIRNELANVGSWFEVDLPKGYPKALFQAAMLTAGASVYKKRGLVKTSSTRHPKTTVTAGRISIRLTRVKQ